MFDITRAPDGAVLMRGRLDAVSVPVAREFFAGVSGSARIDCADLDYIASAGLGLLAAVQRRLRDAGQGLTLCRLSPHVREVLDLAGFTAILEIE